MLYYEYQFKPNKTQEVLMNNGVVDSIIASMLAVVFSTLLAFILQRIGLNTPISLSIAVLAFLLLLLIGRSVYPTYKRKLTLRLVEETLNSKAVDDKATRNQIVTSVLQDHLKIAPIREFANQVACETEICEAFRSARKVKILTIRGANYFLSSRSLLYDLYITKKRKDTTVDILVLSPQSAHISEELARKLGHDSAEQVRRKMRIALENLNHLAEQNKNFNVRCYTETPYFKLLLFDDVMFVSSFTESGGPKNDENAKMWQIAREGNPIFTGLERHFDLLWERSFFP